NSKASFTSGGAGRAAVARNRTKGMQSGVNKKGRPTGTLRGEVRVVGTVLGSVWWGGALAATEKARAGGDVPARAHGRVTAQLAQGPAGQGQHCAGVVGRVR